MDLNEYQRIARKTAIYPNVGNDVNYPTLGLCGEAGEFADKFKKVLRDDNGIISPTVRHTLILELGDVFWYLANIACELKVDLNTVAELNQDKLSDRAKRNVISGSGDTR